MEKKSIGILLGLGLVGVVVYFIFFNKSSSGNLIPSGSGGSGSSGGIETTGTLGSNSSNTSTQNSSKHTFGSSGNQNQTSNVPGTQTITSSNGTQFDITHLNSTKKSNISFTVTPSNGNEGTVSLGNSNNYNPSTILSQIQKQTPYSLNAYVTGKNGNQHQLYGINNFKTIGTENGKTSSLTIPLASFKSYLNGISTFLSKNTKTLPKVTATGNIVGNNKVTVNDYVTEPYSNKNQKDVPTGLANTALGTGVYDYATGTVEVPHSETITYKPSEFASAVDAISNTGNQNIKSKNILNKVAGYSEVGASNVLNGVGTGLADIGGSVTGFFKGLGL